MDEQRKETEELAPETPYVPRPAWQLWAAWFGLVIVIVGFLLYVYHIATGGL